MQRTTMQHVKGSPEFPSVLDWAFLSSILHKWIVQDPPNTEILRRTETKRESITLIIMLL